MSEQLDVEALVEQVTAALDGGVPLLYAEDRKTRRATAESALTTLVKALEKAERERIQATERDKVAATRALAVLNKAVDA